MKFSQKFSQFTPASSGAGLRTIQAREIARGDLRLIYNGPFQWQSRLIVTSGTNIREVYPGYALAQQLALQAGKFLKPTFQFVVFEVRDWSQRIYLHEPGLYYDFSFPVCYGSGQKLVLTLTLKPFQKWTIAGKMALTTYYRQYTHNPGNDLIHGKEKWNLSLQIRANL